MGIVCLRDCDNTDEAPLFVAVCAAPGRSSAFLTTISIHQKLGLPLLQTKG